MPVGVFARDRRTVRPSNVRTNARAPPGASTVPRGAGRRWGASAFAGPRQRRRREMVGTDRLLRPGVALFAALRRRRGRGDPLSATSWSPASCDPRCRQGSEGTRGGLGGVVRAVNLAVVCPAPQDSWVFDFDVGNTGVPSGERRSAATEQLTWAVDPACHRGRRCAHDTFQGARLRADVAECHRWNSVVLRCTCSK